MSENEPRGSFRDRPKQPWPIRATHWLNVPVLVVMAGTGLQIFDAFPSLGETARPYWFYPFQDQHFPEALRIGGWLAGARHIHFLYAWIFAGNGALWFGYLVGSGEWRRRAFLPRRDTKNALLMFAYYLRIRKTPPETGLYNGLQRLGYTSALGLGAMSVLSGLVLWKPVQLSRLCWLLGGYDSARAIHLGCLLALAGFVVMHVVLVALHPRTFVDIVTGGGKSE